MSDEKGLTLLEVMVALVVLSVAALGYVELFQGSHRLVAASQEWSQAVAYSEEGVERVKVAGPDLPPASDESLPGGFRREIRQRLWQSGLKLVTVTVFLPGGARFDVDRLLETRAP